MSSIFLCVATTSSPLRVSGEGSRVGERERTLQRRRKMCHSQIKLLMNLLRTLFPLSLDNCEVSLEVHFGVGVQISSCRCLHREGKHYYTTLFTLAWHSRLHLSATPSGRDDKWTWENTGKQTQKIKIRDRKGIRRNVWGNQTFFGISLKKVFWHSRYILSSVCKMQYFTRGAMFYLWIVSPLR